MKEGKKRGDEGDRVSEEENLRFKSFFLHERRREPRKQTQINVKYIVNF